MKEIDNFLADVRDEVAAFDRVLATVLFTDIVGSTERASEMADRGWRDLAERHHSTVRALPSISFLSGSTDFARPSSECYRRRISRAVIHRRCRVQLVGARPGHATGTRLLRDAITAAWAVPTHRAELPRMGRLLWTEWPDRPVDLRPTMGHLGARVS